MSAATRPSAVLSTAPFAELGVPTHTKITSASRAAAAASVVARRRPSAWARRTSSPRLGSSTGDSPRISESILVGLVSTPVTV
jgi:hypothetical protein